MRTPRLPFILAGMALLGAETPSIAAEAVTAEHLALGNVWRSARLRSDWQPHLVTRVHDALAAERVLMIAEDPKVGFASRQTLATQVAQWPDGAGHEYFANYLNSHRDCDWTLLQFFTSLGSPRLEVVFRRMLDAQKDIPPDKIADPSRYAAAMRAFAHYPEQDYELVTLICRFLAQDAPHVLRMSAATTLGSLRHVSSIPALIPHVGDAAIGKEVIGSLYRLTGQDHGRDVGKWEAWYARTGENVPLQMLSLEALAIHRANAPQSTPSEPGFYGVEIKGNRVIFVLDVSGSMRGDKIVELRNQCTDLLSSLQHRPEDLRYVLLSFATDLRSSAEHGELMSNNAESFERALKFVDTMEAKGGTAMKRALVHTATDLIPTNNVDTIYLLSDGEPTDDENAIRKDVPFTAPGPYCPIGLMDRVHTLHFWYQVKIHTISIKSNNSDFGAQVLKRIATATGGDFKES